MAHYAVINEDNIVVQVFVGKDEGQGTDWEVEYGKFYPGHIVRRTSYNTRGGKYLNADGTEHEDQSKAFRKNYGGAGALYWPEHDGFSAKQPFPSWTLNTTTLIWECPVGYPDVLNDNSIGITHSWNEDLQRWEAFDEDGNLSSTWNTSTNAWETV